MNKHKKAIETFLASVGYDQWVHDHMGGVTIERPCSNDNRHSYFYHLGLEPFRQLKESLDKTNK